jgi:hypothetical protein
MLQRIVIALGAGFASAILFIVPAKGMMASALFGLVAPLPLMIAFLGFGPLAGFIGGVCALLVVALLVHPFGSALYGAWVAVPVAGLAQAALMRRADAGLVVLCAAGLSIALGLALVGAAVFTFGSWNAAVMAAGSALSPFLEDAIGGRPLPEHLNASQVATAIARYAPAMAAAWMTATLSLNLWIAARLSYASRLLSRGWPNVPDTLRLPRVLAAAFAVAIAGSFAPALIGVVSSCFAAGLGMAFALQGLGALHAMTRGIGARGLILSAAYALMIGLVPWPLALAALLGAVDCLAPLPRKPEARPPFRK